MVGSGIVAGQDGVQEADRHRGLRIRWPSTPTPQRNVDVVSHALRSVRGLGALFASAASGTAADPVNTRPSASRLVVFMRAAFDSSAQPFDHRRMQGPLSRRANVWRFKH